MLTRSDGDASKPRREDGESKFGAIGGGTLSRDSIANSQKTTSPRIDAMDALQAATKAATPDAEMLQRVIGAAYEAGVSVDAPQMKKAAALLAAIEQASPAAQSDSQAADTKAEDGLDSKLNVLFSDDYAFPDPGELDF